MNRSKRKYAVQLLSGALLGIIVLSGCPKKTEVTSAPEVQREEAAPAPPAPAAEQAPAGQAEKARAEEKDPGEKAATSGPGLQPVYFDFDRSLLRPEAREVLKANAAWLKAHPQVTIKIEGNCDERGTREYNQALGQRRATSAKRFLTDLGIAAARISLISYGKEKPACTESAESCWQKNRRDEFVAAN